MNLSVLYKKIRHFAQELNDFLVVSVNSLLPFLSFVGALTIAFSILSYYKASFIIYISTFILLNPIGIIWFISGSNRLSIKGAYDMIFKSNLSIYEAEKLRDRFIEYDESQKDVLGSLYIKNKNLHDKFHYEFVPLIKLARHKKASGISLIKEDTLGYDGELHFEDGTMIKCEFTTAIDHEEENRQHEQRNKYGRSNVFEKVESTGTKHNRRIPEPKLVAHESKDLQSRLQNQVATNIRHAISNKVDRSKSNKNYNNIVLAITYDDMGLNSRSIFSIEKEDICPIIEDIKEVMRKTPCNFQEIYIISRRGDLVHEVYSHSN